MLVGLLNAGSLGTAHDEFIAAMNLHSVDIIAINETWLRQGEDGRAPKVPGYKLRHIPRPPSIRSRGGGVGFYIRRGLNVKTIAHPEAPNVEQMWLIYFIRGIKLAIGTAYRPPWLDTDVFLDAITTTVSSFSSCDHLLLVGDFNINLLDHEDSKTKKLKNFLSYMNLTQHVTNPTHFTTHSRTLIDLVCADIGVSAVETYFIPELSSHALVKCQINIPKKKIAPKVITFRPIKSIDMETFAEHVNSTDWSEISAMQDVDCMVDLLNSYMLLLFDVHAPLKTVHLKERSSPWITPTIKEMMKTRNLAHDRYLAMKSQNSAHNVTLDHDLSIKKKYYKDLKAIVASALENEKAAFHNQYINKHIHNSKILWKNMKKYVISESDSKDFEVAAVFRDPDLINNHFLDIPASKDVPDSLFSYYKNHCSQFKFDLKPVTELEVAKTIRSIKTNAMGVDGISLDMVLLTLPATLGLITEIINQSIKTCTFPRIWKSAVVKPIPKKSNVQELKDLRPISILPCLSKILEKLVCSQISLYLETNNILPTKQSGFRKFRSTTTALIDVVDNMLASQDAGNVSVLTLLDFSRAFDTINLSLLIAKLEYYGFSADSLKWITSYLSERTQYVELRDSTGWSAASAPKLLSRGVPQGSILGPILFIIYTADIVNSIRHCNYHMYADDIQLYISFKPDNHSEAINKLNEDLDSIANWASSNQLVLNPSKSKFLLLGYPQAVAKVSPDDYPVRIKDEILQCTKEARNLGVLVDSELRFENHILEIARSCFYRLKILYRIRKYLSEDVRVKVCETLILSKLTYADALYGPRLLVRTQRLVQRIQNACARFCFYIPPRTHITPYINKANLLNMKARRELHLASLLFGVLKSQQPAYLYEKLSWCKTSDTRSNRVWTLQMPRHFRAAFRGSFKFAASKCWNDLPPPLRDISKSKVTFKKKLKIYLLQRQKNAGEYLHT